MQFARLRPTHEDGWHVDHEARFQSLSDHGLRARAEVVLSNDWLWLIRLHPKSDPANWAPRFGEARVREGLTDYHISIVEKGFADALIADIAERWHDRDITVHFTQGRGSGGSMNLKGGIADDPAVIEAHRRSEAYGHKPLHVSM
jgi:hypothetical protein